MRMSEGAERALISDYAHANERGIAFGWYHLANGIATIRAGLLFGTIGHFYSAADGVYVCWRAGHFCGATFTCMGLACETSYEE